MTCINTETEIKKQRWDTEKLLPVALFQESISRRRRLVLALMDAPRNYCMAAGNAVRPVVFEAMTMSMLHYQQKKIDKLEKELNTLREQKAQTPDS